MSLFGEARVFWTCSSSSTFFSIILTFSSHLVSEEPTKIEVLMGERRWFELGSLFLSCPIVLSSYFWIFLPWNGIDANEVALLVDKVHISQGYFQ